MQRFALLSFVVALSSGAAHAEAPAYQGQQTREIKALSEKETADLLAGRGMGMARAAELNHYPGPAHVLELKDQLKLTPDQVRAVEARFEQMSAAAKPLGVELVDRERSLDAAFRNASITSDALSRATAEIGDLQGRLRAVHLMAHLEAKTILTPEQVSAYDALRGYADAPPSGGATGHHRGHGG
jgi:Spy/CpxP family protein refolding chaperone